jgi:hypothetical protein
MPIGRRYFEPAELTASGPDEFAEAEMAAAVAAVDAVDDAEIAVAEVASAAARAEREVDHQADLLGAVDATAPRRQRRPAPGPYERSARS